MIEAELKISLDEEQAERLRRNPLLGKLRLAPRRSKTLLSVYYDTPTHALAAAGIALRLRKDGRAWVQTIKQSAGATRSSGFFSHEEDERPAPGGRLVLAEPGATGDAALVAVAEAVGDAPLAPVFETRIERLVEMLAAPDGGCVEMALDEGEVRAGDASVPIREAEFELKEGDAGAIFAVARQLFPTGPVRFGLENKAARGYRLLGDDASEPELAPRNARTLAVDPEATVEATARDVFRDCLAQIATNMVVVAVSDAPEGPHQLRVGLRRLRSALAVFGASLGKDAVAPLSARARDLGRVVGHLRDADVLADEVVATAPPGLDDAAKAALGSALAARRDRVRAEVRAALGGREATAFVFDLGAFIEVRGWLSPSDYSQTERLAASIGDLAPGMLAKRLGRVLKRGRTIRKLDGTGLHELRKELKKLRYAVDMLGPLYPDDRVGPYLRRLKSLQDGFGSLNDATMAAEELTGPTAPAVGDPDAQRAVGWILGGLARGASADRPVLFERWDRFAETRPFWE